MIGCYLALLNPAWWASTPSHIAASALVTLAFAFLGRLVRGVTGPGAIAGGAISFLLIACAGPGAFVALFSLFVVRYTHEYGPKKERFRFSLFLVFFQCIGNAVFAIARKSTMMYIVYSN